MAATMNADRQATARRNSSEKLLPFALVTECELEGNCSGWDGTTVFYLANGEAWQQTSWRYRSLHLSCPAVRVWRLGTRFLLEVEGSYELLPVQRVN